MMKQLIIFFLLGLFSLAAQSQITGVYENDSCRVFVDFERFEDGPDKLIIEVYREKKPRSRLIKVFLLQKFKQKIRNGKIRDRQVHRFGENCNRIPFFSNCGRIIEKKIFKAKLNEAGEFTDLVIKQKIGRGLFRASRERIQCRNLKKIIK